MTAASNHEVSVALTVNGQVVETAVPTSEMLYSTLRDRLGLTGANLGCDHASCGACTVIVDGEPRASCATFTWSAEGRTVTTIEGVGSPAELSPVQAAFAECSAMQCGYCTPGLVMTATALLKAEPNADEATVRDWLSSNICRCTGYQMIVEAVQQAQQTQQESAS